jgi:outer membrane immunogenic protein
MRIALGLAGAAMLVAGPALAADLIPVKAPPPIVPNYNWNGFYVGGNLGWVRETDKGTSDFLDPGAAGFFGAGSAGEFSNPQSNSTGANSAVGGIQAGYNWQISNWVLGLEADYDWAKTSAHFCRQTDIASLPCSENGFGFLNLSGSVDWVSTVRGRLGVTWDRFLIYGTGGVAFGKVDTSINATCEVLGGCGSSFILVNSTADFSEIKAGWVVGAGIEALLTPHWIARVEYLHIDLGTASHTLDLVGTFGPQSVPWSRSVTDDAVRGGISYKF